jgi:hypothetical protein
MNLKGVAWSPSSNWLIVCIEKLRGKKKKKNINIKSTFGLAILHTKCAFLKKIPENISFENVFKNIKKFMFWTRK